MDVKVQYRRKKLFKDSKKVTINFVAFITKVVLKLMM